MDGGELEFQKIYATFQPKLLRYVTHLVGELEAEDLTQEVFAKIAQTLKTFRGESQLSTWIYRIATNAAIDKLRAASFRQAALVSSLDDCDEVEERAIWREEEPLSPEQRLMRQEMHQCFSGYVRNLPANYRAVIILSELEELSNNEIADILGLSLDAVKIRLHRGLTRLFQELKLHCHAEDWL
jgi:RNA polymerase sigma-70 factor (ECF subfamily)